MELDEIHHFAKSSVIYINFFSKCLRNIPIFEPANLPKLKPDLRLCKNKLQIINLKTLNIIAISIGCHFEVELF